MQELQDTPRDKIRIGISSCLLGHTVRWNAGHKRDRFLTDTLGRYVDYVPVCPEVECGLPTPREPMRLVGEPQAPRLVTSRSGVDKTDQMLAWARRRVAELETENLCGFIFKSASPSSGMERVRVYNPKGVPEKKGVGLFARAFMDHFPRLPVEEDGRLHDPRIRENFIERLFALRRWRRMLETNRSRGGLVDFHTRHKLLILAHSPEHYARLGPLVATAAQRPLDEVLDDYEAALLEALCVHATPGRHANVLMHLMGYFKDQLSPDEKQELLEIIRSYTDGHVPLVVPMTLANHYVRKYDQPYLKQQWYLSPHPLEL
ncbi:MAG: YbgA family protein [Candidatus Brocadiia bacterium]